MDAFQEFRTQSSSSAAHDAFAEFRPQALSTGDGFAEFRASSSPRGGDAYREFRARSAGSPPEDSFEEFRTTMMSGAPVDEFSEFRSPAASSSTRTSKPRQLMRRFLRLAPGPIVHARQTPQIEDLERSDELRVTVPLPGAHAEDVHVQLHAADLVIENALTHAKRTIALPSAVLPAASAAFKDGKLSVTLHKCASPLDSEMHPIIVR